MLERDVSMKRIKINKDEICDTVMGVALVALAIAEAVIVIYIFH